jgi:HEAT repeat protein
MSDKREEREAAKGAKSILNEPARPIPGGARRESVRVSLEAYPQVERRLRLNRLLLAHDPEVAAANLEELVEEDVEVLRRMAQESVLSGNGPVLRCHAIAALARFPSQGNVDLLAELARLGEDPSVRGAALAALADTGLASVLPALKEGLAAKDPVEWETAQRAMVRLGGAVGVEAIQSLLVGERRRAVRTGVTAVLGRLGQPVAVRARVRRTTATD